MAGTSVDTLLVTMVEDASTIVDAGAATTVNITSANDAAAVDQVATFVANGDVALNVNNGGVGTLTDVNITATVASEVTFTDSGTNVDTITGDANTTLVAAVDLADFTGLTITGVAGVQGVGATADVTGIDAPITVTDNTVANLTVADGASVTLAADSANGFTLTAEDDGDNSSNATQGATLTLAGDATGAIVTAASTGGDDTIDTLNIIVSENQTASIITLANGGTLNLSGAGDITGGANITSTVAGGILNASGLTGALSLTASANLLDITGGSGNDAITAVTGEAFDLDGGLGTDTLGLDADMSQGTFTGFEVMTGTGDFLSSQLNGLDIVVSTGAAVTMGAVATKTVVDSNTIDLSGLTFADPASDGVVMTGALQDTTAILANSAMTITGSNGADVLVGFGGADVINGGAGGDVITGGAGADTLTGGLGADNFTYATGVDGADTITDFLSGTDTYTTDFVTTLGNGIMVVTSAAVDVTAALTVDTAVSDVVQVTGVTHGADMSAEADVIAAISDGTINVTASDTFMLSVTDGTTTYLYEVSEDGANALITAADDTITLIATLTNGETLATNDILV